MVWNWFSPSSLALFTCQPLFGRRWQMEIMDPWRSTLTYPFWYISFYLGTFFFAVHFWAARICNPWCLESSIFGLSTHQVKDDNNLPLLLLESLNCQLWSFNFSTWFCHGTILMYATWWFSNKNQFFLDFDFMGRNGHNFLGPNSFFVAHHRVYKESFVSSHCQVTNKNGS